LAALEERLGVMLPQTPGLDTLACVQRAAAGGVRFAMHLGGNLYGSCPDAAWATKALGTIDLTVFLSTTLNTGHMRGRGRESIILPVLARDEEQQPTTQESMFSYVRLSDGGARRFEGPRSEVEVIAAIARRVLVDRAPFDFAVMERHASIREAIAAAVPDLAQLAGIDRTKKEFVIPGRIFHAPKFPTVSGRARFHATPLPAPPADEGLRLMTIRSEGQFNTVVYEDEDIYRGQERRDVIMMNAADLRRLGLKENGRVRVESATGAMDGLLARALNIREGNAAMYYPEANALVPAVNDPQSKTPPFKNIAATVRPSRSLNVLRPATAAAPAST
jgi:anaerobic selenocysteine-containing dehydrogenase